MANLTSPVIVLAGGRARRLSGVTKALLLFRGKPLLDHALAAWPACHRVVVGPPELVVPGGVSLVREDPPFGGPVAGIAAGLAEIERLGCAGEWVVVTACDHPYAREAAEELLARVAESVSLDGFDLITPTDSTGHRQTLFALYRRTALADALARVAGGHNCSVRRLVADLRSWAPALPDGLLVDVDDPATAAAIGVSLPSTP